MSNENFSNTPSKEHIEFLNRKQTLEYVLDKGYSLARYGDGEMKLVFPRILDRLRGIYFQKWTRDLRTKLAKNLLEPKPNLLVCVDHEFTHLDEYHVVIDYERSSKTYEKYSSEHKQDDVGVLTRRKERALWLKYLNNVQKETCINLYGEATCFMLCFFYVEYLNGRLGEIMDLYRRMLARKRVLFVCPKKPLMGQSFEYLCSAGVIKSPKSVDFLFVPERHCFENYPHILDRIHSFKELDAVFVQAGPTAAVLVADLAADNGFIAYDVGSWNVSLEKAYRTQGICF